MTQEGTTSCLADETLVELVEGQLSREALSRIHRHAAGCADCHDLLASMALGMDEPASAGVAGVARPSETLVDGDGSWTPPASFDEFRLDRLLGRGAMGVVYLAHDTSLDRRVAVKFIAARQPEAHVHAYFETEARAIARLQHPNVVTVYRVGSVDGRPYIVSEYIDGASLAEQPLPMPWRRALTYGIGLARGLAAAHRQGVLHRDIKPSNVLVTLDGDVKLLDFGLAERVDLRDPSAARTLVGTPRYMAPELRTGAPATPLSDVYALGLVLYGLCTGKAPPVAPAGGAEEEGAARLLRATLDEHVVPDLAALVARCVSADPARRFASADELREALERLERSHASEPLVAGNPYRGLAPFEAEHRALFFGRDADVRAVLERLKRQPMVLIAADSGVGKSSLCRAGVLPRVAAGALGGECDYRVAALWPGRRPLDAVAAAFAPVLGRPESELSALLAEDPARFAQVLREKHREGRGLLLFVDQLEELITLSEPAQAARVSGLLGELALPAPGVHLRVLLAVRGDFLTRVTSLPGLGDEAERALYLLRPMTPPRVREAIVGPARSCGASFESEELIQSLVAATAGGVGGLPLLQFVLAELWERRDPSDGRITRAALDQMGGVAGALSRHADGVLARLVPAQQRAARQVLMRLVTSEGTRFERREEELSVSGDARAVLRTLVEGRLVYARTAEGQASYQIAHDALIESWGTLRDWVGQDVGQRAARQRVEVAAAEWERLGRSREALWGQRQVDEARALDASLLGPREGAFLLASARALGRRRLTRWLAVLAPVLVLAVAFGVTRLVAYREARRSIDQQLEVGRRASGTARDHARRAAALRDEALALFDGRARPGSGEPWEAAEQRWAEALGALEQADLAYASADSALQNVLRRDRDEAAALAVYGEILSEQILLADRFHQRARRDELQRRLEQVGTGADERLARRREMAAVASLSVAIDPPDARVEIEQYAGAKGALRPGPVSGAGLLGLEPTPLPPGSYRLRVSHPARAAIDVPVLLARGQSENLRLWLPAAVPDGYAYVAPGCFLAGSDDPEALRRLLFSPPMHRVCMDEGYLIGRTEVTFGDWLAYLDTLPPGAPARSVLASPRTGVSAMAVTLRWERGAWTFSLSHSGTGSSARAGEMFHYPGGARDRRSSADWRRFPLSGVSAEDLKGYFDWLDHTGKLPGARLCTEREWERAARGADGRRYPHGDRLLRDDADIDSTYRRNPLAYGPDEVGSHPGSVSPFGLFDMAGNANEMTLPTTPELGRIVYRGGSWYIDETSALTMNRSPGDPTQRIVELGARTCASFHP